MKVTNIVAQDIRFPTSKENLGTDAVHVDCDYSATYVTIETDDKSLKGIGVNPARNKVPSQIEKAPPPEDNCCFKFITCFSYHSES